MVRTSHRFIDNAPNPSEIENLKRLCFDVLDPIWSKFGPLWITSGYRCEKLNMAVGSTKDSAHLYGCAADFVPIVLPPLLPIPTREVVSWLVNESGLDYDQVIDEYSSTANWIHVGIVRPIGNQKPRRQALTMRGGKYSMFSDNVLSG